MDCARLEEMAKSPDGARAGGFDPRALMAMMGCRPAPAQTRPEQRAAAQGRDCRTYREILSNHDELNSDWLGPMPVLAAQALITRCGDIAASPAERRAWTGLAQFADGRFVESAQALRDAAAQATGGTARLRYTIEMGKSLLAAGRNGEAQAVFEKALSELPARVAAREVQPRVFGAPGMDSAMAAQRIDEARARGNALRLELLTLLGIGHLGANNVAGALGPLAEADKLVQAQAREQATEGFVNPVFFRHAPYLALALQRAGRSSEAQAILERILGGREQFVGGIDQLQQAMPMVQQTMSAFGVGDVLGSPEAARGFANMDTAKLVSGELTQLALSCSMLEELHIKANLPEAALETAERCRGRVLARLLASRAFHRTGQAGLPSPGELEAYMRRHNVDRGKASEGLMKERLTNPQAEAASRPAAIADMRRMAAERRATLVVYSINYAANHLPNRMPDRETGITVWVVAPEGTVSVRHRGFDGILREGTLPLTTAALRAHEALGVPGRGQAAPAASQRGAPRSDRAAAALRQFYQLLIEPIEDLLPARDGARIIVVPQGPLFLVPFAALENAQGAPFIARYALSVTPSLQTLALTHLRKQAARKSGPALIVGNPVMPRYAPAPGEPVMEIPPLPGAEQEANAIAALLKVTPLTGAAATKAAVVEQAREARFVHLATHGFLDDGGRASQGANPYVREFAGLDEKEGGGHKTPGMLAFAPGAKDNGMLTADEIAEAGTNAELVVMSACGSGQGMINDDGVIGLSRAWMAAGAPSVVVSLWSIPDEPTRDLMVEFYRRLAAGSPKAEALREAMLATRAKYPNPVNWAAFVLLGEPD
jgi:CHAT domain-containing protein/tetratricopeptide (TPR) repeat protein